MAGTVSTAQAASIEASPITAPDAHVTFAATKEFQVEVRRRVEDFLRATGRPQRDCPQMYLKTAVILAIFVAAYVLLVFFVQAWWQVLPLAGILGLAAGSIGFNIQHDGSHHAYSNRPWINKLAAMTMDMVGASSYFWRSQHVVLHHTYVNITGHDPDVSLAPLARLTPQQTRLGFHRWQHWYVWPLYAFMAIRWHLYGDFYDLITGRIGQQRVPRPKRWDLAVFILGKALFVTLAFVIPSLYHPFWKVFLTYALASGITGVVLAIVFQLAHCVEEAEFPTPQPVTGRVEHSWAVHQVETTVDFARNNALVSWLLGGLNFQIEHHLFPRICHVNYPAISKVVQATCDDFGIRYSEHPTFWAGMVSHYRWLKQMGAPGDERLAA